jgi:hypothetical protein
MIAGEMCEREEWDPRRDGPALDAPWSWYEAEKWGACCSGRAVRSLRSNLDEGLMGIVSVGGEMTISFGPTSSFVPTLVCGVSAVDALVWVVLSLDTLESLSRLESESLRVLGGGSVGDVLPEADGVWVVMLTCRINEAR